jgi:hypothetical protein
MGKFWGMTPEKLCKNALFCAATNRLNRPETLDTVGFAALSAGL